MMLHKVHHLALAKDVPYNLAFIELAEAPRSIADFVGAGNEELHIGMPIEACSGTSTTRPAEVPESGRRKPDRKESVRAHEIEPQ